MLYGGRSAIGAVISSEVDVGRWAAEVARGAVQPRGLGAYAAFLGGIHAGGYGNDVLARRALCQRSIGGHWCGPGTHRARRDLRDAHIYCARRHVLQRPSSCCIPLGGVYQKGYGVGQHIVAWLA